MSKHRVQPPEQVIESLANSEDPQTTILALEIEIRLFRGPLSPLSPKSSCDLSLVPGRSGQVGNVFRDSCNGGEHSLGGWEQ